MAKRGVESSSAKIERRDTPPSDPLLVEAVGDGRSGRLADDAKNVEAANVSGALADLTLRAVQVCWYGDDGVCDVDAKRGLMALAFLTP